MSVPFVKPMPCPTQDQLKSLLDESLSGEELTSVGQHVDSCEASQTALDELAENVLGEEEDASSVETLELGDRNAIANLIEQMKEQMDSLEGKVESQYGKKDKCNGRGHAQDRGVRC